MSDEKGCREGLIDLHHNVVKDVEGLVVAAEDERGTHDVQGVDGKRLAGHQAVRLNLGKQNNSSNASLRCLPYRVPTGIMLFAEQMKGVHVNIL